MKRKLLTGFMLALMLIVAAACSSGSDSSETVTDQKPAALVGNDFLVTITTDFGVMRAVLHDQTPKHKENFIKLAREGFFDSLLFHRVIPQFMIQGGDPLSKNAGPDVNLGTGGPGYTVDAEILPEFYHKKGALSAARRGGPGNPELKSSGSQFYIVQGFIQPYSQVVLNNVEAGKCLTKLRTDFPEDPLLTELNDAFQAGGQQGYFDKVVELKDKLAEKTGIEIANPQERIDDYTTVGGYPSLDGQYTVFGQVIDGLDILDRIAGVQTKPGDRPVEDVRMFITVEEMPKAQIAREYGHTYL